MTNEAIKILLMIMLLGGLRTAMFVTEMPKPWRVREALLDWIRAQLWPPVPDFAPHYQNAKSA